MTVRRSEDQAPQRVGPPGSSLSRLQTAILLGTVAALYVAVFPFLYDVGGDAAAALSFVPIALAGYLYGPWGGVGAALASFPIHQVLFWIVVPEEGILDGLEGGLVALVATTISGYGVGKVRAVVDHVYRLRAEVAEERDQLEDEVHRRRTAEARARHRRRVLEVAMESAPLVLVAADAEGTLQQVDLDREVGVPGQGYDREDLEDDWPELAEALERALDGERFEETVTVGDRAWELHGHPLGRDGQVEGATVVGFDVTEWRTAAEARERAQREAERASRMKSAFLANTSHEIRTPMTAILGMAQLLEMGELDEDQQQKVATIRESGDHLIDLIDDILDLSKIEAGHLEVGPETVNLVATVRACVDMVADRAQGKGLELDVHVDSAVPRHVRTDPQRFRQILVNLLSNAVKHTAEGAIRVEVAPAAPEEPGTVAIAVHDTGIGIPKDLLDDIFTPFTQADGAIAGSREGTGLGLSIAEKLVELLGGSIGVESTVGEGSTFRFTVDAAEVVDLDRRVLVGLSAPDRLGMTQRYLRAWDLEPMPTTDPDRLLRQAREQAPAVVLLDQEVGGRSAEALAGTLRGLEDGPKLVVLAGGDPGAADAEAVDAVLEIPVSPSVLHEILFGGPSFAFRPPAQASADGEDPRRAQRSLDVLVAEDAPVNRTVLERFLSDLGHEVTEAENGREAVEAAREHAFELVLMDIRMPEMDGLEATRRILDEHGEQAPKIVAVTANADAGSRRACLEAGMDGYLAKPWTREELQALIADALDEDEDPEPSRLVDVDAVRRARAEPEAWKRLADPFEREGRHLLDGIDAALDDGEPQTALRKVHALQGQGAVVGAQLLEDTCEAIRRRLEDGRRADSRALRAAFQRTCQALREAERT